MSKFMDFYKDITLNMMELCEKKNNDYGSSVQDTYNKFGDLSYLVRITDKYNRICSLMEHNAEISDETIDDTIKDMANYCLLWLASKKLKGEMAMSNPTDLIPQLQDKSDIFETGDIVKVRDNIEDDWKKGYIYLGTSINGSYMVKDLIKSNAPICHFIYCASDK